MQTIISLLVILRYIQFCHPKSRRYLHVTSSCVVVSAAYPSDQAVCCGQVSQRGEEIKKLINGLIKLFIIGFYNVLRL